jgi:hypothetical protein
MTKPTGKSVKKGDPLHPSKVKALDEHFDKYEGRGIFMILTIPRRLRPTYEALCDQIDEEERHTR